MIPMTQREFLDFCYDATTEDLRKRIDQELSPCHKLSAYELGVMHSKINQIVKAIIRKGENNG